MSTVTRIVQQKDQNRASVYLDRKFAFGISIDEVFKNNLKVGGELSQWKIEKLKEKSTNEKIYYRAIDFGTRRPRSEQEFKLWFRRKKIDETLQGETLQKLTSLGLVNDLVFAKWWVEQRSAFRPMARRVLKLELLQKGIDKEIIESALEDEELPSEEEQILKVAQKRWERLKNLEDKERKQKLAEFLARRGFSWDTIKDVLQKLTNGGNLE
ncbi:MAG: RecX family transcriptional regulator [bacterium]|nr:RecX family transcriptional regulator [bacterium]